MAGLPPPPIPDIKDFPYSLQQWFQQIRTYVNSGTGTIPWTTVSKTGANITDIPNRSHNNLQNFDGGNSVERYHLTNAQHKNLTALTKLTSVTSLDDSQGYILVDATSGGFTLTLPAATNLKEYHIKKINATNTVVIAAGGFSDTIQGSASVSLTTQYSSVTLYSDGLATWYIKGTT